MSPQGLRPVTVLFSIAEKLPEADRYDIVPTDTNLVPHVCEGGMRLPDGTVAVRRFIPEPSLSGFAGDPDHSVYDAGIVIQLPDHTIETTLIADNGGDWSENVREKAQTAVQNACAHAGCEGGKHCILRGKER